MTAKTALGLTYPLSSDHTRLWEHIQQLAADADALLNLPAEQTNNNNSTTTITTTSGSPSQLLSTPCDVTMTNPHLTRNLFCRVEYGAWLAANGAETRALIQSTGGLTITSANGTGGALMFGDWLFLPVQANSNNWVVKNSFNCILPPNTTTTFFWTTSRGTVGTFNALSYPTLRVTPQQYIV